jgi:hypothetical protein
VVTSRKVFFWGGGGKEMAHCCVMCNNIEALTFIKKTKCATHEFEKTHETQEIVQKLLYVCVCDFNLFVKDCAK